ncbi:hypothetical protein B0H14DRAFT_3757003 [Mycena olivaceomarginata]|nr:hypothetical protein B0H14DRAFT_3757003 [Mycena olivaceomarginata]
MRDVGKKSTTWQIVPVIRHHAATYLSRFPPTTNHSPTACIARPSRPVTRIYSIAICFSVLRSRQSSALDPTLMQPDFVWLKLGVEDAERGDVKNYHESASMASVLHNTALLNLTLHRCAIILKNLMVFDSLSAFMEALQALRAETLGCLPSNQPGKTFGELQHVLRVGSNHLLSQIHDLPFLIPNSWRFLRVLIEKAKCLFSTSRKLAQRERNGKNGALTALLCPSVIVIVIYAFPIDGEDLPQAGRVNVRR